MNVSTAGSRGSLPILDVITVPQMGWAGIKNGDLMRLAKAEFDVFVTVDRNLSYQQNLPKYSISLIVLRARSNRYLDLIAFAEPIRRCLGDLKNGEARLIEVD